MNKKLLVVGDVHLKLTEAIGIFEKYHDTHKIIFMGDHFDDFGDSVEKTVLMAKFVKEMLNNENVICLWGNHDIPYRYSQLNCPGFTPEKNEAINSVITVDDWNKFKFFHYENGYYFSHAGITNQWFSNPVTGVTLEGIQKIIDGAVIELESGGVPACLWAADRFRGGSSKKGGLLWNDWRNSDLIPNMKQIMGHTPLHKIQRLIDSVVHSTIINVDCHLREVLEIDEDGVNRIIASPHTL